MKTKSRYQPPWWLANRHLQTILPNSPLRPSPGLDLEEEVLELPDGDYLRLDWMHADGPLVVLLHGLEGSSESRYARGMMQTLRKAGCATVMMHFRGCGGAPNRLERGYHAGDTGDLAFLLDRLSERYPGRELAALGVSLGGNVLLKYLGEQGTAAKLKTAVAISVPFDLQDACAAMSIGFSRLYQSILIRRMKNTVRRKFSSASAPFDFGRAMSAERFDQFDDVVTAPLHGFASASEYYRRSSSRSFLKGVSKPTLILHSTDDPFMTPASVPDAHELSDAVVLEVSDRGGHVGFLYGDTPWSLRFWLEERAIQHFSEYLDRCSLAESMDAEQPLTAAG